MTFKLFSCCIPVRGALRSTICDVQRRTFSFIPNKLHELLIDYKDKDIDFIKKHFNNEYDKQIEEYYDFLLKKEYVFACDNPEQFPSIEMIWKIPSVITNAVIDFSKYSNHDIVKISKELEALGCLAIQFRFYDLVEIDEIQNILQLFNLSRIHDIQILMKSSYKQSFRDLEKLCLINTRVSIIIVHSNKYNKKKQARNCKTPILFIKTNITNHSFCGFVNYNHFVVNITHFTESQKHNTCLNRKISIDTEGNIKNCPSMSKSYGNIRDTTLREAIEKQGFKDVWYIHKDQIEICKDCEFRHICTDCRAYIQDPNNIYSKPAKCSYNPYTATWGEDNPTNNPLHGK
ncbi:grasp-with-spasm system SPASM domain peptide maturase [Runella slithyformis]|uniref:4Fe4S-binding SPASM domain-containing protein n=1 Tax=Runella slithyformis (strain ATCC 29530 / DSM 19594 / LMG 11500 / NCIMB 11436 / LSU 4) TaxID=761193 RepID=A0A7U4E4S3_RUNSL|nr:grasp-with-spasm system SPASM domain peptide maturase [Runella slithyformis]AEI47369.1 hypothetical protein Runsl_0933 [Runella slithyformis DSM 19594]